MQVHWKKTKGAKRYRKWFYGNRGSHKPYKEKEHKKTRLEVLAERRKKWERMHENDQRNGTRVTA